MTEQKSVGPFDTVEYKRARKAYVVQCAFEYLVYLLIADAFLAKLLTYLGLDDATTGIISSFISLAFTIQIFSIFLCRKKVSAKKLSITFNDIGLLLFMALYFIPFTPIRGNSAKILVMVIMLASYSLQYLVSTILYRWANSFVRAEKRASFAAKKEMISLISGMFFTAAVGYIFDRFEDSGNIKTGFLMIAALMLLLVVGNFVCLYLIGEEKVPEEADSKTTLSDTFKATLGNKSFRLITLLAILWESAKYFTLGFMGVYKTNDLLISVFLIQIINILGSGARVLFSTPFGKYSDKTSFAKGTELGLLVALVSFVFILFTTPKTWFLVIPYTILYNVCLAGVEGNSFNISYNYVDAKYISEAMAIKNLIGGLFGFGASLIGAKILTAVNEKAPVLFGCRIYGQQVLAICSLLFTFAAFLLCKCIIEKLEMKKQ